MLHRAMKRIWPSLICVARSNILRQAAGLMNGKRPSKTNIRARAPSNRSIPSAARKSYRDRWGAAKARFTCAALRVVPDPDCHA
jgi:hypothetical protein